MSEANAPKRVTRRTIAKGAAWTVPAVVVAAPAASAATSPPDPVDPEASPGTFCQHSNVNRYHGVFCFNNTAGVPVTVTLGTWTVPGGTDGVSGLFNVDGALVATRVIPTGQHCYYVDSTVTSPMANGIGSIDYTWSYTLPGAPNPVTYTGSGTMIGEATGVNCASVGTQPNQAPPHATDGP